MAYNRVFCPLILTVLSNQVNNMNNREKGNIGENIACDYLINKGYLIIERNFLRKWGEIDIIAIKDNILNFFEVKSVIYKGIDNGHKPEDNVHEFKIKKLRRIVQTYLNEYKSKYSNEQKFKFHVISVKMDVLNDKNIIEMFEDLIL